MTGREALVVLRGLETSVTKALPDLFHKLATVTAEVVRLESLQSERQRAMEKSVETQRAAQDEVVDLKKVAATLTKELASERDAARRAWEAEAAERTTALDAVVKQKSKLVDEWTRRATDAEAHHKERVTEMQTIERTLSERVAALRAHAEQMLRSAEAVLR